MHTNNTEICTQTILLNNYPCVIGIKLNLCKNNNNTWNINLQHIAIYQFGIALKYVLTFISVCILQGQCSSIKNNLIEYNNGHTQYKSVTTVLIISTLEATPSTTASCVRQYTLVSTRLTTDFNYYKQFYVIQKTNLLIESNL